MKDKEVNAPNSPANQDTNTNKAVTLLLFSSPECSEHNLFTSILQGLLAGQFIQELLRRSPQRCLRIACLCHFTLAQ